MAQLATDESQVIEQVRLSREGEIDSKPRVDQFLCSMGLGAG